MAARNFHEELVQLAQSFQKELRYKGTIEGFCYGSSALVIGVVLTSKEAIDEFNAELLEIQKIADDLIKSDSFDFPILPENKTKLLWFLYKMLRHQYPHGYTSSQELSNITTIQNLDKTMSSFQSEGLTKLGGLHKTAVFSAFFNLSEESSDISNYINALQTAVSESFKEGINIPFSLLCSNSGHAFELGYRPNENPLQLGSWYVFDMNKFNEKVYELEFGYKHPLEYFLSNAARTSAIKETNYIINTTFYCSKNNEEKSAYLSKKFLSQLEQRQLTRIVAKSDAFGYNLLHMQALNEDFEGIYSSIQGKIALDSQTNNGATALIIAAQKGFFDIARLLIENGANLNIQTKATIFLAGSSAILYAARNRHVDIVKLLLDHGADASGLHHCAPTFEEKFCELMFKKSLTLDEKKHLLKLYIILRTAEEVDIKNCIRQGLTAFFKPECDYKQKIKIAQNLLEALNNNEEPSFALACPALQEGKLQEIYALCFEAEILEDSPQTHYHAPASEIPGCY